MGNDFNFLIAGYTPSSDFNFGADVNISFVLYGSSNNFTSIWADENSGRAQGKMYVASADAFTIIDLSTKTVYDRYTQTLKGRGNEVLSSNDIVDINVA